MGAFSIPSKRVFSCLGALLALVCMGWLSAAFVAPAAPGVSLTVLGNVQDGGYPHIGCQREDCRNLFLRPAGNHAVVCLGLVDSTAGKQSFSLRRRPMQRGQAQQLSLLPGAHEGMPDGIFPDPRPLGALHRVGIAGARGQGRQGGWRYLPCRGSEISSKTNGPWSQLVTLGNIALSTLVADEAVTVTPPGDSHPFSRAPPR